MHFIGNKGVSMEFLASLCGEAGITVTGSDLKTGGHDARNVIGADVAVYSFAIGRDNPEIIEANKRGIPLLSRAELLGEISRRYDNVVAVSGTHGKTTTTAMLMSALLPLNPTVHVGGSIGGTFGRIGGKRMFVTEACEYKESFLSLSPDACIVLNVELDHADYYKTYDAFYNAFDKFTALSKVAFVCGDNEARTLRGRDKTITFGLGRDNDYYAVIEGQERGYYSFWAYHGGEKLGLVRLKVRGEYNVINAMAVIAYCHHAGIDYSGLENFCGVDRRFESLGIIDGVEYISDYAHHPHEIECTLTAAKKIYGKVLTVFEPHTYTRTQRFFNEFACVLSISDDCMLLPIYAARENPLPGVSSDLIAEKGGFMNVCSYEQAIEVLKEKSKNFDAVIFMGAGTVDDLARAYVHTIEAR